MIVINQYQRIQNMHKNSEKFEYKRAQAQGTLKIRGKNYRAATRSELKWRRPMNVFQSKFDSHSQMLHNIHKSA